MLRSLRIHLGRNYFCYHKVYLKVIYEKYCNLCQNYISAIDGSQLECKRRKSKYKIKESDDNIKSCQPSEIDYLISQNKTENSLIIGRLNNNKISIMATGKC